MGTPLTWTEKVLEADRRIRPHVAETPMRASAAFSAVTHAHVFVKEEQHQRTGSFKLRGAFNRLLVLSAEERSRGVVAASSGNHGAAVAYAASVLQLRARVYVPEGASAAKVELIRGYGAEVTCFGTDGLDAEIEARAVAERSGAVYVSPYNDATVIAGQGTVAAELVRQGPSLERVYVAVGGGGLIAGIAAYLSEAMPGAQIVGALPENSPVMAASVRAGSIVEMPSLPTLSDGTAGGIEAGSITFALCQALVHEWVLVSEAEIARAMRQWAAAESGMIEGAAGVALAAALRDRGRFPRAPVAVVICGGNVSPERWTASTTGC